MLTLSPRVAIIYFSSIHLHNFWNVYLIFKFVNIDTCTFVKYDICKYMY